MHARLTLLLVATLAAALPGRAAAQDAPPLGAGRVAAQVGAGIVAMPVGFVVGGKATEWVAERVFGVPDPRASRVALVGGYTGAALLTSAASAAVGARGPGTGRFAAALGGALVGGAGSALLVRLNDRRGDAPRAPCRVVCTLSAVAVFALPSAGAAVGYAASRRAAR